MCVHSHVHRRLTLDEKYALCRSVAEECIQEQELRNLLEKKPNPIAYDGFEPSGRMHIAQVGSLLRRGHTYCGLVAAHNGAWRRVSADTIGNKEAACIAGRLEGVECQQAHKVGRDVQILVRSRATAEILH